MKSYMVKQLSGMHTISKACLRVFWVALAFLPSFLGAQTDVFPPKPEPAVYVHDFSNWLDRNQVAMLEEKLRRYHDSTSTQLVVMIRPDLGDYDKSSYAIELGNRWGIGKKSKNNGVVMLIKSEQPDRGIFIATGYGTEGALPDILAGQIIRNTMGPFFREKKYYEGIDAGTNEIIKALSGEFKNDGEPGDAKAGMVVLVIFLIIFFLILFFVFRAAKRGARMITHSGAGGSMWGAGWGAGSGWGGGGSSGGSSWGGGSDGGSFGGGSFGGGGAGGDW
ncbi:MAG: TPM domain-containing protein [Saprospiraceae bacterium]|nr:TPM domain-containing protein [Saprospiraceae bacterium]